MPGFARVLILAIVVVNTVVPHALALISAPNSSAQISDDGTRILVMLSPDVAQDRTPTFALPDQRVLVLHQVFPSSGVYHLPGFEPVWQGDWFAQSWDLWCSGDLRFLVRRNRFGYQSDWAIAFYDNGKLVRSYACAELLTGLSRAACLPYTSADWHTRWYGDWGLGDDGKTLWLQTARREIWFNGYRIDLGRQEHYTFDLATGRIVERRVTGAWVIWAYALGLGLALVLLVLLLLGIRIAWRRFRAARLMHRPGFPVVIGAKPPGE
jgi:hypothetical protein